MPLIVKLPGGHRGHGPDLWRRSSSSTAWITRRPRRRSGLRPRIRFNRAFETGGFGKEWAQWSKRYSRRREMEIRSLFGDIIGPVHPGSLLIQTGELRQAVTSRVVK